MSPVGDSALWVQRQNGLLLMKAAGFFGSPICAEYLQAYLSFTGDAVSLDH